MGNTHKMFFGGFPGGGDPFEEMLGGGRGGKPADTTGLYKILGVDKDASDSEIKKAYRKLAMKHHPDKGGDPDTFKGMTEAHTILSDPEKRSLYDRGGMDAVESGGGGGGDMMSQLFGQNRWGGRSGKKKGSNVVRPLPVSLEDLYNGVTKKLRITRQVIDKEAGVKKCKTCGGKGVVIKTVRMGPMIQQMQSACSDCGGQGFTYSQSRMQEVLEVHIDKGAPDGHKCVFHNKADEIPDGDAGDVVFVLKEKPHDLYRRHGADLYVKKDISLVEALCGFEMELPKLDGRTLVIKTKPGDITNICTFDPFAKDGADDIEWEVIEDADCDLDDMAQAQTDDVDALKQAVSKGQLKGKGIGCFVMSDGQTTFKQGTRAECMAAKKKRSGHTMYVVADESKAAANRMMRCVEGEGLPLLRNPYEFGNLFLDLTIVMPESLSAEAQAALKGALPPALHSSTADQSAENVDTKEVTTMDPVASHKEGVFTGKDSYDEDDDEGGGGGRNVQCAQQ